MSIGVWQVVLILAIVLIIFGAGRLPKVMGDVAKGIKSFKKGMQEADAEPQRRLTAERAAEVPPPPAQPTAAPAPAEPAPQSEADRRQA